QGVELGEEMAAQAKGVESLVHPGLQLDAGDRGAGGSWRGQGKGRSPVPVAGGALGRLTVDPGGGLAVGTHQRAADGAGTGEELLPARVDRGRVLQPASVQPFDEVDVGAGEK